MKDKTVIIDGKEYPVKERSSFQVIPMDREKLKEVAGLLFKDLIGGEPDTLEFEHEEDGMKEYGLNATFGSRQFRITISAFHNRIHITEGIYSGSFGDAAELAGYDRKLNPLKP